MANQAPPAPRNPNPFGTAKANALAQATARKTAAIDCVRDRFDELIKIIAALENACGERDVQIGEVKNQLGQLKEVKDNCDKQIAVLNGRVAEIVPLQNQLKVQKDNSDKQIAVINGRVAELQKEKGQLVDRNKNLETSVTKTTAQVAAIQSQLSKPVVPVDLKALIDATNTLQTQLANLKCYDAKTVGGVAGAGKAPVQTAAGKAPVQTAAGKAPAPVQTQYMSQPIYAAPPIRRGGGRPRRSSIPLNGEQMESLF